MKRTRTLIILVTVLAALIVGTVVVNTVEKHIDSIQTIDEVIVAVNEEDITCFSWDVEGENLEFTKQEEEWVDAADASFPVDQDKIKDFLKDFESVHASFIIEDIEDYSQYGLEDPESTIVFSLTEGELTIALGDYSIMDEKRYVSIGDGRVYLIDTDLLEHVSVDRDDFILNDTIPSIDTILEFDIAGDFTNTITYEPEADYLYTDDYDYFMTVSDTKKALSTIAVTEYMETVSDLKLTTYATYIASLEDLSVFGLDKPALTITVSGENDIEDSEEKEEASYVLYVGYVVDPASKPEEGEEPDKLVYVRLKNSEIVYSVSSSVYETLVNGTYDTLRPTEVISVTSSEVKGIRSNIEGNDIDINYVVTEGEGTEDEVGDYYLNNEVVDASTIISDLKELIITDFKAVKNDSTVELDLTVTLENEEYPEVNIVCYRNDGDTVLVECEGELLGLISRSSMVALKEAIFTAYLNLEQTKP